jgi:hypothetical protein
MNLIAHRGNIRGKTAEENHPIQIMSALDKGFEVEVDVHFVDGMFKLGHDSPLYTIEESFLIGNSTRLWCHAKNSEALQELTKRNLHCFWHQEDDYTITSKGRVWVYPGKRLFEDCVMVLPERTKYSKICSIKEVPLCGGVCSDYICNWIKG